MRHDVEFLSRDALVRAWLFVPSRTPAPAIAMAHGLGGTRDGSLEPYAERFARAGFVVLVFDYRHFGASEGQPRQLLDIAEQLEDWKHAIHFLRERPEVDADRIGLWGTSFSGGHVLQAAVADGRISAITSQCPMMDGLASALSVVRTGGVLHALRVSAHGVFDLARARVGASPHYIPIVGRPGTVAAMATEDAEPGLRAVMPRFETRSRRVSAFS